MPDPVCRLCGYTRAEHPPWSSRCNGFVEPATPHRLTGTTRYERGIQGDERRDYGGPAGRYDQMVSDED